MAKCNVLLSQQSEECSDSDPSFSARPKRAPGGAPAPLTLSPVTFPTGLLSAPGATKFVPATGPLHLPVPPPKTLFPPALCPSQETFGVMDMFIILVVVMDEYRCQNVSNCTL